MYDFYEIPLFLLTQQVDCEGSSLVPSLFIARGISLVKGVFKFDSVRQDLGMANQIAEQCLRHRLYLKTSAMLT